MIYPLFHAYFVLACKANLYCIAEEPKVLAICSVLDKHRINKGIIVKRCEALVFILLSIFCYFTPTYFFHPPNWFYFTCRDYSF